jgi:hypothetical protein
LPRLWWCGLLLGKTQCPTAVPWLTGSALPTWCWAFDALHAVGYYPFTLGLN